MSGPNMQGMDVVPGDQYRYALANFRIAHEKVESQRVQLEEQERQIALLRQRIALLEGADDPRTAAVVGNSSSIDDWTIRNAASSLDRQINRYAAQIVKAPPVQLAELRATTLNDLNASLEHAAGGSLPMVTQNLLRHAMAESLSEGVLNCFLVTNSAEANVQLSRIHENLFARDPIVACVWRRQTFSASIDNSSSALAYTILSEFAPNLCSTIMPSLDSNSPPAPTPEWQAIVDGAQSFGRMLHAGKVTGIGAGQGGDAFYRCFVPEMGAPMVPQEIELVKRCMKSERGEGDRVGATLFPGLVKVTNAQDGGIQQTVVRRAQCICECALAWTSAAPLSPQSAVSA